MRRDVARLFDAMADSYERLEPWYEHLYARVHGILRAELRPAAAAVAPRALDAGCGTGFQAAILEDLGWRVHGVDIAGRLLVRARTHLRAPALALATLEALPYRAATFDAVTCCGSTLSFVDDPVGALRELGRVLRPGGRLLLSSWAAKSVFITPASPAADGGVAFEPLITELTSPADIGYDVKRRQLLVPLFHENALYIQELPGDVN